MQSAQRPPIRVTLVGLRNPLSPPLPEKIVGREPDVGRVHWDIDVQNTNAPMYTDFYKNRLHTNDDKGGAFLSHSFTATLSFVTPSMMYTLSSVGNLAEVRLRVNDGMFNNMPIFDLQEENAANQALVLWTGRNDYDMEHPEKYQNLSWLPDLVMVKHHQFYMPKQDAKLYHESYMERILNTLYFDHYNKNRLSSQQVSYVELLNRILPEWQNPSYPAYRDTSGFFQAALDSSRQNASFYAYDADDYGSDYVIFPRSQTLKLSPELVIHLFGMIDEIKATLFLQHQIILFILQKLTELRDEDPIPQGILMDLQLFEKELLSKETLENINQPGNKQELISLASEIASKFDSEKIALTRQFDELLKKRSQVLFNHLKIVMRRDMPIATQIRNYQRLEQELNPNIKVEQSNNIFNQFEQEFNSIIENPNSEVEALVSSIKKIRRTQKKNSVILAIFNDMFSYFEEISALLNKNVNDINGKSDVSQYIAIADVFFNLSGLYFKICFLSAIVQVPRWLKNIRLQYDDEKIPDQEALQSDNQLCHKIKAIASSVFSEKNGSSGIPVVCSNKEQATPDEFGEKAGDSRGFSVSIVEGVEGKPREFRKSQKNFNYRSFSRQLVRVIDVQLDVFFKLVAYMADYLYAQSGEKITISIMHDFVKISFEVIFSEKNQNLSDDILEVINIFFLAKIVDPVNNNSTYEALVRFAKESFTSEPKIFSLINVFISENQKIEVNDFHENLSHLAEFCHTSVQCYARNNNNEISYVERWAKNTITTNDASDDIPYLLKVLVVQTILLGYQRKGELGAEGVFTLALSYLQQKPKNIYMACQMFNHLLSIPTDDALYRALEQEQIEVIIEALDRCEAEGFVSQRMVLEKINQVIGMKALDKNRRTIVSKRLLHQLATHLAEFNEKALATTTRSPVKPSASGSGKVSVDNLFSLSRISKNKGLEIIAFPVLELLFKNLPANSGLYNFITSIAENTFPALYREFSIAGANLWCLYAIVIAYLVKEGKSLEAKDAVFNDIYPRVGEINTHWSDFFSGRSHGNIALSYRALIALKASYQDLESQSAVSPAGQQAIDMLINAMMLKEFPEEYFALLSMLQQASQNEISKMMNFLIERKNDSIPFAIKAENIGCLVIDKETSSALSIFGTHFNTFLRLVKKCGAIDGFSVLVILIHSQKDSLSVDRLEIVGVENPDLFDFAWYLKHSQKQEALAEAIMASRVPTNDNPNLTEILNVLKVNPKDTAEVKQQLSEMIQRAPVELINKSPEHLQLAFILYNYLSLPKNSFSYFIAQRSERLLALFFINEIFRLEKENGILQSLMFSLYLSHRDLTLVIPYYNVLEVKNSSEDLTIIKEEMNAIVGEKKVNDQISSAISYFGRNSSPPTTPEKINSENEENKNGYK